MITLQQLRENLQQALEQKGTYAAVKPHTNHAIQLLDYMHSKGIPNPEASNSLHVTLLYSRKYLPDYEPDTSIEHDAYPINFEVWPTKSGKNCLVLKLDSPTLVDRHEELMDNHGATYDYPEYKTHMSLSYDIGDFDISGLDIGELPYSLLLTNEYNEDLDTDGK